MSAPAASVLIVNHNAGPWLARCLAGLRAQTRADFEAILLDNASTDDSMRDLDLDHRFRVIRLPDNAGFARGNNLAAAQARAPWLALLNPDAVPAPDWLERLLETAQASGAAMVASIQLDAADDRKFDGVGDQYHASGWAWRALYRRPARPLRNESAFSPCGAAALYRTDAFRAAGGFDEAYFCYFEDVDLGFRLRLLGHDCALAARAVVRHAGGGTSANSRAFATYHGWRNRLWTFVKDMPGPLLAVLAPYHVVVAAGMLVNEARRGSAGPALRGLRDGIAGLPALWRRRAPRTAPLARIAAALRWSPLALLRRD